MNKNKRLTEKVLSLLKNDKREEAKDSCYNSDGLVAKVLLEGINYYDKDEEVIEKVMDEVILSEIPKAERYLPLIAVVASMLPMMGALRDSSGNDILI